MMCRSYLDETTVAAITEPCWYPHGPILFKKHKSYIKRILDQIDVMSMPQPWESYSFKLCPSRVGVLDHHDRTYQSIFAPGAFTNHLSQKKNVLFPCWERSRKNVWRLEPCQSANAYLSIAIGIQSSPRHSRFFSSCSEGGWFSFDIPIVFGVRLKNKS